MRRWVLLLIAASLSWASASASDKVGATDHPLLTRYPGFEIRDQAIVEYDEADVILGPLKEDSNREKTLELKRVEGRVHNTLYFQDGKAVSQSQVFRNYENALRKLNAEILYSCMREQCFELRNSGNGTYLQVYLTDNGRVFNGVTYEITSDTGILTARFVDGDKMHHILLVVSADDINEDRFINQSIIESSSMDIEKIAIGSVDELERMIAATGKAVLDGIYFDHDRATITSESRPTVSVITDYLQQRPDRRFFVVGHTDGSGAYEYNLELSIQRARTVVQTLLAAGVSENQLRAFGIGPVSPAGSNNDEAGLANNRRVELVEDISKR